MTRVLVCGGRDFEDQEGLMDVLDDLHFQHSFSCVIEGEARGADRLARTWALLRGVTVMPFPADWKHGRHAGRVRNQAMLDLGHPDLVVAFPGGIGTADMVKRSRKAGLSVFQPLAATP